MKIAKITLSPRNFGQLSVAEVRFNLFVFGPANGGCGRIGLTWACSQGEKPDRLPAEIA